MEALLFLLVAICMIDCCMTIQIKQQLKTFEKENTKSGEYEKQIKNYRSIVRSQGKIIRMNEKKEEVKNVQINKQENRRIY